MKKLIILLVLVFSTQVDAQLFPIPIKTKMIDILSKGSYKKILADHRTMTKLNTEHWLVVEAVSMAIIEKHDRLFIAGSPLALRRTDIINFINIDARQQYYRYKYPLITDLFGIYVPYPRDDFFKNVAIRYRYDKKVDSEIENIEFYLGKIKPGVTHEMLIPEGERMLFTLQALGNIINYTLENETY
ncbi:hypothetical protein [Ascidiimonas sp. W6]|uniref:hypothetical protein n=1 Tax=Ascidiimonas meishanensis TaxID=3128903 RepID=UPI0030ED594D